MRVKLFSKNARVSLNELYKDGTFKPFSWKDWWSGKNQPWSFNAEWREDLAFRKSQDLEDEINAWLSQNPKIKVVDIKQSAGRDNIGTSLWLISVWYEEAA